MNNFSKNLKQYLKFFLPMGIIFLVLLAITIFRRLDLFNTEGKPYVSTNNSRVYGDQRVFDYADMLTDEEEQRIAERIAEAEYNTGLDIVIVTLNETLKPYGDMYKEKYNIDVSVDKYVMVYADEFWETNRFGYNCPQKLDGLTETGDGVILVDNTYREEETGRIYTWFGTTGKGEEEFSNSMIEGVLDSFYDYVDYDYYEACMSYVDRVERYCAPAGHMSWGFPVLVAIIAMIIFFCVSMRNKGAKVTTNSNTYVVGKKPSFPVMTNTFLRKTVSKVYNPPTSSSSGSGGGGGHHLSGGGGSHGGGGRSR